MTGSSPSVGFGGGDLGVLESGGHLVKVGQKQSTNRESVGQGKPPENEL